MFAPQSEKNNSVGPWLLVLLTASTLLLAGMFSLMEAFVVAVVPVLKNMQPIMTSIDGHGLMAMGRIAVEADNLLDGFSIEDLQIVPSDIPHLARSVLGIDLAPLAENISSASQNMLESITGESIKDDDAGITFADVGSQLSLFHATSSYLKTRKPVNGNSGGDASAEHDPWRGLPSMIFDKNPISWLHDQTDPTKLKELGDSCAAFRTQLAGSGRLQTSFHKYDYDSITGTIRMGELQSLFDQNSVQQFLDIAGYICTALQQASQLAPREGGK